MPFSNANANCNVDSYGHLDSLAYTNGNTYSNSHGYTYSGCFGYTYSHRYSNVHGDGDCDANADMPDGL